MISGFGIVAVKYHDNKKKDYIDKIKMRNFNSEDGVKVEWIGEWHYWHKEQIIDMVTETPFKKHIYTVIEKDGSWVLGSEVEAYPKDNPQYLRTMGNVSGKDNLGKLPVF